MGEVRDFVSLRAALCQNRFGDVAVERLVQNLTELELRKAIEGKHHLSEWFQFSGHRLKS